jgi:uncharacterized membrane protein YbhN (UPF0104 family)
MTEQAAAARARRPRARGLRRLLPALLGVAVVGGVFGLALPRIASYGDVLDVVSGLTWKWGAVLLGAVVLNVVTFAPPWVAALPGLGLRRALVLTQAATAVASVVPGGEAVGMGLSMAMMSSWGFSRGAFTAAVAIVSGLNVVAKVLIPAGAVMALLATGGQGGLLAVLAAAGVAVVAAVLAGVGLAFRSERSTLSFGRRLDPVLVLARRLLRRSPGTPLGVRILHFRRELVGVLRRRWLSLSVWTLIGHLTVFLVLLACVRAVGISAHEVHTVDVFAGWALTRLLTAIPVTPGGLGIIELGLTGALLAAGGAQQEVVAAVLLYRVLTWGPTLVLGILSALVWRRLKRAQPPAPAPS